MRIWSAGVHIDVRRFILLKGFGILKIGGKEPRLLGLRPNNLPVRYD